MNTYFTYSTYEQLIESLTSKGFKTSYFGQTTHGKTLYLRHDIDFCVLKALEFAKFEASLGVASTYFLMLENPAYNLFCPEVKEAAYEIVNLGHQVGLHYVLGDNDLREDVIKQCQQLEGILNVSVQSFSFHRPAYWQGSGFSPSEVTIEGKNNAYSPLYFGKDKYISDSNHHWRCGSPLDFVQAFQGESLQILTHPIWWTELPEDPYEKVQQFIAQHRKSTYDYFQNNVTLLQTQPALSEER